MSSALAQRRKKSVQSTPTRGTLVSQRARELVGLVLFRIAGQQVESNAALGHRASPLDGIAIATKLGELHGSGGRFRRDLQLAGDSAGLFDLVQTDAQRDLGNRVHVRRAATARLLAAQVEQHFHRVAGLTERAGQVQRAAYRLPQPRLEGSAWASTGVLSRQANSTRTDCGPTTA